ncbi:hypothetical protein GCM10007870_07790 [Gluconobacter kondonii]|uniref:Transposase n=1 Tax=Gluconobacter kondonii TaxID=941463 RepID=A0ABQ5WQH3_9PROT|nr:hypothetical protein GCM10007870_07790 [Gluconobacter kondonii]
MVDVVWATVETGAAKAGKAVPASSRQDRRATRSGFESGMESDARTETSKQEAVARVIAIMRFIRN